MQPDLYAPPMDDSAGQRKSSIGERLRPMRGHLWALVVLLGSVGSVFILWQMAYERELRAASVRFVSNTQEIAELLRQQLVNYELVAGGGASLFASVNRPTPRQWYGYADGMELARRFPEMVGLGFAGYVSQSRLDDLQIEWRQAGWGQLEVRPRGVRSYYGPILYLEPRTVENVGAIGFDMFSEATRHAAMQAALETGEASLSGPVHLIQDSGSPGISLLLYLPVYRGGDRPTTVEARHAAMLGWVYVPFRLDRFIAAKLGDRRDMRFRIYDVTDNASQLLYTADLDEASQEPPAFTHNIEFDTYGRRWRMEFDSLPQAQAVPRLRGLQNTLALGLFASLLMYAVAWMLAQTESRAHGIALRLTEDFRRSEQRFRIAMTYSAIGKALLDSQGRIVEANPAMGKIVGITPKGLVGKRFDALFEDDEVTASERPAGDGTDDVGVHRSTRRLHREGGEPRHAQLTYSPLPGSLDQDIVGLVQVEDVTKRLRAEAKVLALNRTLEARVASRTRELSQANQELEAFAYSVSHDLRAPLRAIDGFSRILAERYLGTLDAAGQGYLERVRNAASRMGELIDALLKMSRLGRGEVKRERVDLSRMAGEIVEDLRAGDRDHAVEVLIAPSMFVDGDAALLRNLLGNLIGNAWKFTRGSEQPRIEIAHQAGEFYVRDNGAGFAQEYVDKLFRPFQRLHDQNQFAGHGIGLASVKRVVERHGGTIRAEGREGEGATFYFTLPGDRVEH